MDELVAEIENLETALSELRASIVVKAKFEEQIFVLCKDNTTEVRAIPRIKFEKVIGSLQNKDTKWNQYYYYCKKYYVTESEPPMLFYTKAKTRVLCIEEMWEELWKVHTKVGNTGRTIMEKEGAKFFCNMTRTIINIFLKYSEEYQLKRKKTVNHGRVVKPILSDNFNSRMQIDLVDMQSCPDGKFKWVLNAQDHLTKYCHLRPLESKEAVGVAKELYLIFSQFGCPIILQSDNGKEFRNKVVRVLKVLWPGLQLVHGRARRPQTQGSVERSNGDWQSLMGTWMRNHKTTNWSLGLALVQHQKNRKFHRGINTSPYNALFGRESYDGLEQLSELSDAQKDDLIDARALFTLIGNEIVKQ